MTLSPMKQGCPRCGGQTFVIEELLTHLFVLKGNTLVMDDTTHREHGSPICTGCGEEVDEERFEDVRW